MAHSLPARTRNGARPFVTRGDNSRNLGVMALLAWGEGWHNILGGLRPALVRIRSRLSVHPNVRSGGAGVERQNTRSRKDRAAAARTVAGCGRSRTWLEDDPE